jgi:hypothetical protein
MSSVGKKGETKGKANLRVIYVLLFDNRNKLETGHVDQAFI